MSLSGVTSRIKVAGFILGPALFMILLQLGEGTPWADVYKVLAVAAWMIIWWMTESAPIPVTALLPMVLIPYTGVFSVGEATAP
ncbi:MAG: anion transporter, partial [Bacteroidota bacterium]